MALSQNTLEKRQRIYQATSNSNVFRAGNIPRRRLANGGRIVASTAEHRVFKLHNEVYDKDMNIRPEHTRQTSGDGIVAEAVQETRQADDEQGYTGHVQQATETAVDSPFSQMSITEQERERQPPQQKPPAANMVWSRLSTQEPGEIREDSPGARRRGKLPMRDSPRPTTSVPAFGGYQILRSDVVPESPLFCAPDDTPGSSAMSPESMEYIIAARQQEARRDAEDGLYEPSQAGTPGDYLSRAAQEELSQEAQMLSSSAISEEGRRRRSMIRAEATAEESRAPVTNGPSAPEVDDIDSGSDSAMDAQQRPLPTPLAGANGNVPASAAKRRSPEPHHETPAKRRKAIEKEEGLLQSRAYSALKEKGRAERDGMMATIESMWGVPCHEAIPKRLWVHDSKGRSVEPRDWATNRILLHMRKLAVHTPENTYLAVKALRQAISERTRTSPRTPPRIHVENDLVRAIEIVQLWSESRSPTIGRSQAAEVAEETLADVLRQTAEPLQDTFYDPVSEQTEEESDDSVTVAKVDSPSISPTISEIPVKIESSSPVATPASRLLQDPKSRAEVMAMDLDDFDEFERESEKRLDNAKAERRWRIGVAGSAPTELSVLSRDQLERYRDVAKADWELSQQEWRRRAEEQSQRQRAEAMANAIVID